MHRVIRQVEKKLAEVFNEKIRVLSTGRLGGGCINHALKLETNIGSFFLKWNDSCPTDMFRCEAGGLQALNEAANGVLVVPEVICCKAAGHSPGFLVLEYLDSGASENDADEQLGRGLAEIHRFRGVNFGFFQNNYCGVTLQNNTPSDSWPEFYRNNRLGYLLNLIEKKRGLSLVEKKIYEQLLSRIPCLLSADAIPVLIHGDLWSGNYMLTSKGPALIDPAAYYADREMEFAIITMFGGFSERFFAAYNETLPLPLDWRERNNLYQLYHILNHYYLFGGSYGQQALSVAKSYL